MLHCLVVQETRSPVVYSCRFDTLCYCRTGFDSYGLTAAKIAIVGILYRNYAHYTLYRSCLPLYGITIVRSLWFWFLDEFEGKANISVAIKSVLQYSVPYGQCSCLLLPLWYSWMFLVAIDTNEVPTVATIDNYMAKLHQIILETPQEHEELIVAVREVVNKLNLEAYVT